MERRSPVEKQLIRIFVSVDFDHLFRIELKLCASPFDDFPVILPLNGVKHLLPEAGDPEVGVCRELLSEDLLLLEAFNVNRVEPDL